MLAVVTRGRARSSLLPRPRVAVDERLGREDDATVLERGLEVVAGRETKGVVDALRDHDLPAGPELHGLRPSHGRAPSIVHAEGRARKGPRPGPRRRGARARPGGANRKIPPHDS